MASTTLEKLTSIVLSSAHSQGVLELSKKQIETLGLLLRGLNALKKKHYAQIDLHLKIALLEEYIFKSIGLGLDMRYLQAADQLSILLNNKKKDMPTNKHYLLEKWYQAELIALRAQYQVDPKIDEILFAFIRNKDFHAKIIDQFLNHVSMGFIEKNIDVELRRADESVEEFKTKQLINERMGLYNATRKAYTEKIAQLDQQFAQKKQAQYQPIQTELDLIEEDYQKALALKLSEDDLIRYAPEVKIQQMLTYVSTTIASYTPVESDTKEQAIRRELCENFVKKMVEAHRFELPAKLSDALNFLFDKSLEGIIKDKQSLLQLKLEKITKAEEKIVDNLNKVEKQKQAAIQAAKQEFAIPLDQAERYFNDNILPLVKELNALKANSIFFSVANEIEALVNAHRDKTQLVDANTIAFIIAMRNHFYALRMIDVQQVGLQVANTILVEQVAPKEEVDESKMEKIFSLAFQKVGEKIGVELAKTDATESSLQDNVFNLESTSHLIIPPTLSTESFRSLVDFLPPMTLPPPVEESSFIQLIKSFNQPNSLGEKIGTAKKVFSLLTTPREDCLAQESEDDPLRSFIYACEAEATNVKLMLLMEYQKYIAVLTKQGLTTFDFTAINKRITALAETKNKINQDCESLIELHHTLTSQYQHAKQEHEKHLESFNQKTNERRTLIASRFQQSQKKKGTEQTIDTEYHAALAALTQTHEQNISSISAKIDRQAKQHETELLAKLARTKIHHQHILSKFDSETEDLATDLIRNSYRKKEKDFLKTLIIPEHTLKKYLKKNPDLKKTIDQLKIDRTTQKATLETTQEEALQKAQETIQEQVNAYRDKKMANNKKIAKMNADFASAQDGLMLHFTQKMNSTQKLNTEIDEFNNRENALAIEIAAYQQQVQNARNDMIRISKEFYLALEKFNQSKVDYAGEIDVLIGLAIDPARSQLVPPFDSMHSLLTDMIDSLAQIKKATDLLPTVFDHFQVNTMTPDLFNKQILQTREVKPLPIASAQKPVQASIEQNVINIAGATCIELLTAHPLSVLRLLVSHLAPTLEAQKTMRREQFRIDQLALSMHQAPPVTTPLSEKPLATETATPSNQSWIMQQFNALKKRFTTKDPILSPTTETLSRFTPLQQYQIEQAKIARQTTESSPVVAAPQTTEYRPSLQ